MGTVTINSSELRRVLASPNGPVARDVLRRGHRVQNRARELCPVDTGRLRNSIAVQLVIVNGVPIARVGTNVEYARWVHDGTGLYGPLNRPILPRVGKVLAWRSTGPGSRKGWQYATSVRGMKGRPFLRDALSAASG